MNPQRLSLDAPGAAGEARTRPAPVARHPPVALVSPPAPVAFARYGADGTWRPGRRLLLAGMLGLHGVAIFGLMNLSGVRQSAVEAAPIFLAVLSPPPTVTPPRPLPPPPSRSVPTPPVLALPLIAPEPSASPSPLVAQVAAPPAPVVPAPEPPPAPPAPAPAPAVRTIPTSAVQYLAPPQPIYSSMSKRMKESGKVVVRVFIDEQGLPRDVRVSQSAGFARLDDAAVAAVRKTRFKPYVENGVALSGWAFIPIEFELER
jgi:protein TonB